MYAKSVMAALCACLVAPAPALARQPGEQLTVVAPAESAVSYQKWNDRTVSRLSRSIQQASSLYRDTTSTGYARVQFRLNDQGRPDQVELASPSSSTTVNRISLRSVRKVGSLYPLPNDVRPGSRFEAWIVVANDGWERESMLSELRAQHRAQTMAQAPSERPVLIAQR